MLFQPMLPAAALAGKHAKNMRRRRADIQDQRGIGERVPKCARAVSLTRSYAHKFMHSVYIHTCTRVHIHDRDCRYGVQSI